MCYINNLYPNKKGELIYLIENSIHPQNKWENDLKNNLIKSLEDPSINNTFFLKFIDFFCPYYIDAINDEASIIKDFFNFILLKPDNLRLVAFSIVFLESILLIEEKELCEKELHRGFNDINWIIKEKEIYSLLFKEFNTQNILASSSIINNELKGSNFPQENYFINLLSNKTWPSLDEDNIIGFLKGLDFYYLSDEAYFFVLPACIKQIIEAFENRKPSLMEYLLIFLSDGNRFLSANKTTKFFITEFLNLFLQLNSPQKIYLDDKLKKWYEYK